MAQPIRFKAVVENVERHGKDVVSYRLRSEKRVPRFVPGQFIHLAIDDFDPSGFWPESRVFSVANAVTDRRTIHLTVSRQGGYTSRILDEIQPGTRVWGKGPYGDFHVDGAHGCRRAILIAGGTGITPFCAFMDAAIEQGSLPVEEVTLYYGARTQELLIYRQLAERCAAEVPGFRVRFYVENITDADERNISTGRLDIAAIVTESGNIDDTAFYLSGPKAMVDTFRQQLTHDHGIAIERVLVDAWE